MSKGKKVKIVIEGIILLFIVYCVVLKMLPVSTGRLSTYEEINDAVATAASRYKNTVTLKTTGEPYMDYQSVLDKLMEKNMYAGGEFYAFSYVYTPDSGGEKVAVRINHMSRLKSFLVFIRSGQISGKIKGLSDYEKVKAVHDYIILHNEYNRSSGGACNTLYRGDSACNGYALAFYIIMKKAGVPVTCEYGYGLESEHLWNRVQVDGHWYNIDLTWYDLGGQNVGYDYFLKSDADWQGHDHGGSDAEVSMDVTGKTAAEYYRMFPNYNAIMIWSIIGVIAAGFALYIWLLDRKMKRKKLEKARLEAQEEAQRMEELHKRMQVVTGAFTDEATVPANENAVTDYQTAPYTTPYTTQMAENVDETTMNHEQPQTADLSESASQNKSSGAHSGFRLKQDD